MHFVCLCIRQDLPQYDLPDLPQYDLPDLRGKRGRRDLTVFVAVFASRGVPCVRSRAAGAFHKYSLSASIEISASYNMDFSSFGCKIFPA